MVKKKEWVVVVSQLKLNIIANFVGKGWAALMSLAFIPFYIKFLGIEAYGLIGIFLTLLALFSLLDLGLSTTLNRELARMTVQTGSEQKMRDLTRTLELAYFVLAVLIGIAVISLASPISLYWVKPDSLSTGTIYQAVLTMGLAIACQFPFSLYAGGLMGLQRQVLLNFIVGSMATLRGGGAVVVLWFIAPTIQAFFGWQIIVSVLQVMITGALLWSNLPKPGRGARFQKGLLIKCWRFAAGMTVISVLSVVLMQMDKVILSRILSLETFGYYMFASVVAGGLYVFFGPMFSALFPRYSQLVALGEEDQLVRLYHDSCQMIAVIVLPVAVILALFSREILYLWTQDSVIVANSHLILRILVVGTAMAGLMILPYALQLAHGWTRLAIVQNLIGIAVLLPMLVWLTKLYGAQGAAVIWVLLNVGCLLVSIPFMHTRLIKEEKWRWYVHDVFKPLSGALLVAVPSFWLYPADLPFLISVVTIIVITLLTFFSAVWFTDYTRKTFIAVLSGRRIMQTES